MGKILLLKSNNKTYSLKSEEILYETKMTSNTTPTPLVASASSVYSTEYLAWKAFNSKNAINTDCWITASGNKTGWVQVDFGLERYVNYVYVSTRNYTDYNISAPKDFNILGSNDGINFTTLAEIRGQTNWSLLEKREFKLVNPDKFRYFRFEILDNNGQTFTAIGNILYSCIENLTQLPSDSVENFVNYGASSIEYFNLINGSKNYILQDTISEDTDGLWVQEINRKPLSIKFE